ncbi:PIN domain-containing protein [Glycomyces sp. NPDC046736]|uniref:PIN domain-containing protein n=1 Tax=Glycomyces sp. NPDC046736 TaxID=3155615 RepID=UPI0034064346
MNFLIDTSALVRILRREVDPAWVDFARRRRFAICEPVLCEALASVGKNQAKMAEMNLLAGNQFVAVPDGAWDYVRAIRHDLMDRSMHNMFSVADYLIAATAMQLKLTVLHEDKDFIAAAKIFPQLTQQRITQTLPED